MRQPLRMPQFMYGNFKKLVLYFILIYAECRGDTGITRPKAQSHYTPVCDSPFRYADVFMRKGNPNGIGTAFMTERMNNGIGTITIARLIICLGRHW
ncbi:hypothetical protein D9M68_768240 [compost metagenome]